ncbi:MAG: transposase [Sphingobacteriales bacterium]|nr:transposase [Sphingobacteriales bacterium]
MRRQWSPVASARLVLGALIIKHYLNISDAETILQIQENPIFNILLGLKFSKSPHIRPVALCSHPHPLERRRYSCHRKSNSAIGA